MCAAVGAAIVAAIASSPNTLPASTFATALQPRFLLSTCITADATAGSATAGASTPSTASVRAAATANQAVAESSSTVASAALATHLPVYCDTWRRRQRHQRHKHIYRPARANAAAPAHARL